MKENLIWHVEIGVFNVSVSALPGDGPVNARPRYAEVAIQNRLFVVLDKPTQLRELSIALEAAANALEDLPRLTIGGGNVQIGNGNVMHVGGRPLVHATRGPGVWCGAEAPAVAHSRNWERVTCPACLGAAAGEHDRAVGESIRKAAERGEVYAEPDNAQEKGIYRVEGIEPRELRADSCPCPLPGRDNATACADTLDPANPLQPPCSCPCHREAG